VKILASKGVMKSVKPTDTITTLPTRILYDRLKTGKLTHKLQSKVALKSAKAWLKQPEEVLIEYASGFKASVEAAAKLHPSEYGDEQGQRFAVTLNLASIVKDSRCKELSAEEASEYLEN